MESLDSLTFALAAEQDFVLGIGFGQFHCLFDIRNRQHEPGAAGQCRGNRG